MIKKVFGIFPWWTPCLLFFIFAISIIFIIPSTGNDYERCIRIGKSNPKLTSYVIECLEDGKLSIWEDMTITLQNAVNSNDPQMKQDIQDLKEIVETQKPDKFNLD